jgi:cytochrome P450
MAMTGAEPDDRPRVDFDHHANEYAKDFSGAYRRIREGCPMAWTDAYGGFWVVSRYDDVARVARDDATFSSRHDLPNDGTSYTGIVLPDVPNRSIPIEMDPPDFPKYRRILNPPFAPAAIEKLRPRILAFTDWCLDRCIERGEIDFVLDLANPVPAMATLAFLGLPVEEWEQFATPYHNVVACPPGTEAWQHAVEDIRAGLAKVAAAIPERRRAPRDDLLSRLTQAEIDGELLSDETIVEISNLVLGGGLDTTTALIGHAITYLNEHPDLRKRLLDEQDALALFCEELLRYYSPTQALARTATTDVEVGGQTIRAGERVLICWAGANRDDTVFDRADEVLVDRFPNRHAAFGLGAHRCLGSNFTRAEFTIVMERVLRRMPDYELTDGAVRYESIGVVNGWHRLPARFSPGAKVGAAI